jgi:GxxExxY protein
MTELLHRELTGAIIGVYYEVYNQTLRMYPEYIYESAMMEELRQRGYPTLRQGEYRIVYKERLVGVQRLDLFVVQEVVVENKVADNLTLLHKAQARSYLKTVGKQVGLVFNFGGVQPEFERVYLPVDSELTAQEAATRAMPEPSADWLYPELAYAIAGGLYEVHTLLGPGFIHRIYANACYRELQLRGLAARPLKRMQVTYKGAAIGTIAFGHLVIESQVMVFPVALRHTPAIRLEGLKDWMSTCDIRLGILANFNVPRLDIVFIRV